MTEQSRFKGSQDGQALLAQGGDIATNATKRLGADQAAETAGDLLLNFDHANIALGQTIIKWDGEIVQEGQHSLLLVAESVEQIAGGTLLAPSFALGRRQGRGRIGLVAFQEQRSIL